MSTPRLLNIDNPRSRDSRVQNRNWSDNSCTLVVGTRVVTKNLPSGEKSTRSKIVLIDAVINANYIEPQQFLEDAGNVVFERVREEHDSVKVNTAFNSKFVANNKRATKSINTKNSKIYRCTDLRESSTSSASSNSRNLKSFRNNNGWALSRILT